MQALELLTSIFVGFIALNSFFFFLTFVLAKGKFIRATIATSIASMNLFWLSIFFIIGLLSKYNGFSEYIKNGLVGGAILFLFVAIYIFWLKVFEPYSTEQMVEIKIAKAKIARLKAEIRHIKKEVKQEKSNNTKHAESIAYLLTEINNQKKHLRSVKYNSWKISLKRKKD